MAKLMPLNFVLSLFLSVQCTDSLGSRTRVIHCAQTIFPCSKGVTLPFAGCNETLCFLPSNPVLVVQGSDLLDLKTIADPGQQQNLATIDADLAVDLAEAHELLTQQNAKCVLQSLLAYKLRKPLIKWCFKGNWLRFCSNNSTIPLFVAKHCLGLLRK